MLINVYVCEFISVYVYCNKWSDDIVFHFLPLPQLLQPVSPVGFLCRSAHGPRCL